jgi:hypothetical protein
MMLLAPVTNWEPHGVTLAGYCYVMRYGMKVQIVTPNRVSHLQRYAVTLQVCTHLNTGSTFYPTNIIGHFLPARLLHNTRMTQRPVHPRVIPESFYDMQASTVNSHVGPHDSDESQETHWSIACYCINRATIRTQFSRHVFIFKA